MSRFSLTQRACLPLEQDSQPFAVACDLFLFRQDGAPLKVWSGTTYGAGSCQESLTTLNKIWIFRPNHFLKIENT